MKVKLSGRDAMAVSLLGWACLYVFGFLSPRDAATGEMEHLFPLADVPLALGFFLGQVAAGAILVWRRWGPEHGWRVDLTGQPTGDRRRRPDHG